LKHRKLNWNNRSPIKFISFEKGGNIQINGGRNLAKESVFLLLDNLSENYQIPAKTGEEINEAH